MGPMVGILRLNTCTCFQATRCAPLQAPGWRALQPPGCPPPYTQCHTACSALACCNPCHCEMHPAPVSTPSAAARVESRLPHLPTCVVGSMLALGCCLGEPVFSSSFCLPCSGHAPSDSGTMRVARLCCRVACIGMHPGYTYALAGPPPTATVATEAPHTAARPQPLLLLQGAWSRHSGTH